MTRYSIKIASEVGYPVWVFTATCTGYKDVVEMCAEYH